MKRTLVLIIALLVVGSLLLPSNASARYWQKKLEQKATAEKAKEKNGSKSKEKPFAALVKNRVKVEGLFDFYIDTTDNSVLMAIKPGQFDKTYLASLTRSAGDGTYYDASSQAGAFPFELTKVGKQVQFIVENVLYRTDPDSPLASALHRSISNSIFGSTDVASAPDKDGAVLIDPTGVLVTDVPNASYFLGKRRKTGFRFDKGNSYFGTIKSFPQNSEIDVVLAYQTDQPSKSTTSGSPYSIVLTYHYSLSSIPEDGYQPRLADDRVGYFMTQYQDFTDLSKESPYVRFINRWNLKKKDPNAAVSEPVKPIVFWVENTVPKQFRDLVAKGIEWWQPAFERAGFKNAIIAKQMPDTATWDPADVRYNVIRWVVSPGKTYASGPSRANPFTGEIYDADIRIMADFIRAIYNYSGRYVEPLASAKTPYGTDSLIDQTIGETQYGERVPPCNYGYEASIEASQALAELDARFSLADNPELKKKFVDQYIIELVAHEVGHTLGLRHNFKASTIYTTAQRCDPAFTAVNGVHGSVMEYAPANVAPEGFQQADFFMTVPGPYDNWAIDYGYKPIQAATFIDEKPELEKIAEEGATNPYLVYATDEDCFGNSPRAIDPYTTLWDLGSDLFTYWKDRIDMSNEIWAKVEHLFELPDADYTRLRNVFQYGWGGYRSSASQMARFIGGIENRRDHVGSPNLPFTPVPAAEQREAMAFLRDKIWAPGVFHFRADLINKLQPERFADFQYSIYSMKRVDYPIHDQIFRAQVIPLFQIYDPITLDRINDIEMHYEPGQDVYTMTDIFQDVRRAIWTPEITAPSNINSARRNLQRAHLNILVKLVTDRKLPVPEDARTLARVDMTVLKRAITSALQSNSLNTITRGHLEESLARIDAALKANLNYTM
jgi:hypothetical protein